MKGKMEERKGKQKEGLEGIKVRPNRKDVRKK